MANTKISGLTSATTPLAGTEVVPLVQSSTTKKVAVSDLTAGRAVSMASINVSSSAASSAVAGIYNTDTSDGNGVYVKAGGVNSGKYNAYLQNAAGQDLLIIYADGTLQTGIGNIVQGTAAKGINFTANSAAAGMTSQLLNWYEEGTWTPVLYSGATDATMSGNTSGRYTRIGRVVHIHLYIQTTNLNGIGGGTLAIKGLPFTVNSGYAGYAAATVGYAGNLAITAGQSVALRPNAAATTLGVLIWNATTGTADMTGTEWTNTGYVSASFSYMI